MIFRSADADPRRSRDERRESIMMMMLSFELYQIMSISGVDFHRITSFGVPRQSLSPDALHDSKQAEIMSKTINHATPK
jgi:hypothetical protein